MSSTSLADESPQAASRSPVIVVITAPEQARSLLAIATHAAADRDADILLVRVRDEAGTAEPEDIDAGTHEVIPITDDPEQGLRALAGERDASLLVLPWAPEDAPDDSPSMDSEARAARRRTARAMRRLFLEPPTEAWAVLGALGGREVHDVLVVPSRSQPTGRSLHAARVLSERAAEVVVLDVHPEDADTEPAPTLQRRMDEEFASRPHRVKSAAAPSRTRAMLSELDDHAYDLLVMDVPQEGFIPGFHVPRMPDALLGRLDQPLVVISTPQPALKARLLRAADRVRGVFGTLDEAQRIEVYSNLRRSSRATQDFMALTVLATAVAALGLLLDSATVVIGAMLVAPFMAPTIALGMAVVYGDPRFMRLGGTSVAKGVLASLLVAMVAGALAPPSGLSAQLDALTHPSGIDLLVALLSGAAGAYTLARRNLSAALPSVAIAAALVPPLTATGILLSAGDYPEALRAGLLFLLNLAAVAAASAVIFLAVGFRPESRRFGRIRSFAGGLVLLGVLLVAVTGAITVLGLQDRHQLELERTAEAAVEDWLPDGAELTTIEVDREAEGVHVRVDLVAAGGVDDASAEALAAALADAVGQPVRLSMAATPLLDAVARPQEAGGEGEATR